MENLLEIANILKRIKTDEDTVSFLNEILTESEISTLSKRWRILKMIKIGKSQREIAEKLKVSLCKITRGAKIIKNTDSIVNKFLK